MSTTPARAWASAAASAPSRNAVVRARVWSSSNWRNAVRASSDTPASGSACGRRGDTGIANRESGIGAMLLICMFSLLASITLFLPAGISDASPDDSRFPIPDSRLSPIRPGRQDLEALVGDGDGVFPLCGQRMVLGDHGPAVRQRAGLALAGVDHRLDGESHPLFQAQPLA